MASPQLRTALAVALAIGLGGVGAVLLFRGAPTAPVAEAPTKAREPAKRRARVNHSVEDRAQKPIEYTHEISADLAERRRQPAARHAAVDAAKWRRVGQILDEAGEADLAGRARGMADTLGRALHPTDDVALDQMLIDERMFIYEVRSSEAFPKVEDEIELIELGLNAAQQGGVHPADQVR